MSPQNNAEGGRLTVSRFLATLLFGILAYAGWARSGIYPPWQWPMLSASVFLLGGLFYPGDPSARTRRRAVLLDPIFYFGAAFILLLGLQLADSGYLVMWDAVSEAGMNNPPPRWLPWSVEPTAASWMFNWFVPAWAVLLAVRHGIERTDLLLLLYLMVWNAMLMAVVALVQVGVGAPRMLGLWEIPGDDFFGTFGYVNHAGTWFYLHAALAAGLAHFALRRRLPAVQVVVWCAAFLLCLAAAFLTLSRAAALAGAILVTAVFIRLCAWAWKQSRGGRIINAVGLACIIGLFGAVLYFGAGGGRLAEEIRTTFFGEQFVQTVEGRTLQLPGALEIAADYPLFGCGGWGYRWVALLHIPVEEWPQWQNTTGRANIHCDPLQFLVEFGGVGVLLMGLVVGILAAAAARSRHARALRNWIGLGLLLVFLHSWVDLPFRCPAILLAWCTLIAAAARLPDRGWGWTPEEYRDTTSKQNLKSG